MKKSTIFITVLLVFLLSLSTVSAQEPTAEPSVEPAAQPTEAVTAEPTEAPPTEAATAEPTAVPTQAAPAEPTKEPTEAATAAATAAAPAEPTKEPTEAATAETQEGVPTSEATAEPTVAPAIESAAAVEAAAIPSLTSGFQLQNLSTSATANVVINFYDQAGALTTQSDTIPASSSKTYFPLGAVSSGFNGSVVVQSDQSLAGIVNLLGAGTFQGGASYDSISSGATTVNLPLVLKALAGISSFVNVQNTTSTPANVTVSYGGTACLQTLLVPGNSSKTFDQAADACLPVGFLGSAQATSSAAIVASVVEYDSDSLLAYDGFTAAANSTNPVMPLIIGNLAKTDTGVQIQNAGGSSTDVTVTYTPAAGSVGLTCSETKTIGAGLSANFGVGNVFPGTGACLQGTGGSPNPAKGSFVGAGTVTTNSTSQPLVVIVNQATIGGANSSASSGFNPATATNKVSIPLIIKDLSLSGGGLLFTGYNLANVGGGTASVICSFSSSAVTESFSIPAGGVVNSVQFGASSALPTSYIGSASCVASGAGDKIVAVVNEVGGAGDSLLTYEGFNQ